MTIAAVGTGQKAPRYSLCVQILNHCDDDDNEGHRKDLTARTNHRREDQWMA